MKRIFLVLLATLTLGSCVKNNIPYIPPVNESFDWKTTTKVGLNIPVEASSTVMVYLSPLYAESSLVASGSALSGKPFQTVVDLAKGQEELFIKTISPDGLISLSTYDVVGSKAVKSNARGLTKSGALVAPDVPKPPVMSGQVIINNANGLANVQSGKRHYYLPNGPKIKIQSSPILSFQNGQNVLYVQRELEITSDIQLSFSTLVVMEGGSVRFDGGMDIGWTQSGLLAIYVQKGGELIVDKGLNASVSGVKVVNEGVMKVGETCSFTNGALLYNTGALELDDALVLSNGSVCHNTGRLDADQLSIRNNASFYNYGGQDKNAVLTVEELEMTNDAAYLYQHGFVRVEEVFSAKGKVDNYGQIACQTLTGGTSFHYYGYAGSLLKTVELFGMKNAAFTLNPESILFIYQNGNGKGNSDNWNVQFVNPVADNQHFALILWGVKDGKPDNTIINPGDKLSFDGNVENNCPKKNDAQNEKYTKDYCTNYAFWGKRTHHIPESDYNEKLGSTGGKEPVDKDKDGVPEGVDVDDNDPTVSHVSYFPSAGAWGCYFFEDLWPFTGDYDMNDMVLDFRIVYYTKGEPSEGNPVVYMDVDWKLRAVGSQLQLACGIQLDKIVPEGVATLSNSNDQLGEGPIDRKGNKGLESGQSKAVFALFNNPSELFGVSTGINVFKIESRMEPQEKKVRIRFDKPVAKENLSISEINPFIVVSSAPNQPERGREVHLSTNLPTDKVDQSYFGQGFVSRDNPYKASNGMVWGYMVPESFRYPLEMVTITKAYPNFAKWFQSAGAANADWYVTSIPGNVLEEYLYEPKKATN